MNGNWLRRVLGLPEKVRLYGPQGVTITYADGTVYDDVASVYVGTDPDDHCAVYELMPPRDPEEDRPVNIAFDCLPAMTAIIFPFDGIPTTDMPGAEIRPAYSDEED